MDWVLFRAITMIYVFVDTNIWIRTLSQGRPGCEVEFLDELLVRQKQSRLTLLVPEITALELERRWRAFTDDITKNFGELAKKLEAVLNDKKLWSEIEDVSGAMLGFLEERKARKLTVANDNYNKIQDLFSSQHAIHIPLTPDLLFLARKRQIAGRMPSPDRDNHNDACIVESLATHFRVDWPDGAKLCFCTENLRDFSLSVKGEQMLHPLVKDNLPPAKVVTTLRELIAFHDSNAPVIEPSKHDIDKALEERLLQFDESPFCVLCKREGAVTTARFLGMLCHKHFMTHIESFPPFKRSEFDDALRRALRLLTYREREIIKLRAGFGDGFIYTYEEVAHIFRTTPQTIGRFEKSAMRKLRSPASMRHLARFFEGIEMVDDGFEESTS